MNRATLKAHKIHEPLHCQSPIISCTDQDEKESAEEVQAKCVGPPIEVETTNDCSHHLECSGHVYQSQPQV